MNLNDDPLIYALNNRQPSSALKLIETVENVNIADNNGDTALMMAVNYEDVFRAILKKKPVIEAINNDGESVFHAIALNDSINELNLLQAYGIKASEIDRQNKKGETPVFLAVSNIQVFKELVIMGANLHLRNNNRETLIHRIAYIGSVNELEIISSANFDLNSQNKWGNTPLHIAASYGQYEIVEWLVKFGAITDEKNADGETPLHWAIDSKFLPYEVEDHINVIKTLIQHGADIQAITNKGDTPLKLAQVYFDDSPHSAIKRVLLEYGAT